MKSSHYFLLAMLCLVGLWLLTEIQKNKAEIERDSLRIENAELRGRCGI